MLIEKKEEIVDWCKDILEIGHDLELIQLKANVTPL